jgi:hypothetical protein
MPRACPLITRTGCSCGRVWFELPGSGGDISSERGERCEVVAAIPGYRERGSQAG